MGHNVWGLLELEALYKCTACTHQRQGPTTSSKPENIMVSDFNSYNSNNLADVVVYIEKYDF